MKDVTISRTTGIVILVICVTVASLVLRPFYDGMKKDQAQVAANQKGYADKLNSMENGTYQSPTISPSPVASPPLEPALSSTQPTSPPHWTLVTTFQGGIGSPTANTDTFKVGDRWKMEWTTKQGAVGEQGSLTAFVESPPGSHSVAPPGQFSHRGSGAGTSLQYGAGEYYLSIITNQDYVIRVYTQE